MHPFLQPVWVFAAMMGLLMPGSVTDPVSATYPSVVETPVEKSPSEPLACNCTISQGGNSYPVNALEHDETAVAFYSYGNPDISSANTGLELGNALVLFLYEDTLTNVLSLFIIADIANDADGGSGTAEVSCLPPQAFVSLADDPGEMNGAPPLITGNWSWSNCCTDGGIIEDVGCGSTFNVDLLASTGVDSIVWLTGDIANPTQILLMMSGEAVTLNCGGGICCPQGLDTEVTIVDATCPDTPNGSIGLEPEDGVPDYTYVWSNGESTQTIGDLLPGTYMVTITDSQGCSEEIVITVDISPGEPPAVPAEITLCTQNAMDFFDLTTVEGVINLGSGFDVLWYENINLTGPISDPSNYFSGSTTVYAVVDNGSCLSEPVAVVLEIIISPVGNPASMNVCEEDNGMATFDLASLDAIVSGGNGSLSWYEDAGLSNPIADPTAFFSGSTTVYAVVNDGTCLSEPVEVELIVDPKPVGMSTDLHLCGDENEEAVFDLTSLDNDVSGGAGDVEWYSDIDLSISIDNPTQYLTVTTTVYATIFDGICYSDPVPVDLIVDHTPVANAISAELCDDGTGQAVFDLWDYATLVGGGQGGVNWFFDIDLLDQIPFPDAFLTVTTVIYAIVDDGTCISDPVPVSLFVLQTPVGNPAILETCADSTGLGIFDLTLGEMDVSGGIGTVLWYEDGLGLIEIDDPMAFESGGTVVYAQISTGDCISDFVPVTLSIISTVSASSTVFSLCGDGTGNAIFDLTTIADDVSSGSGQVNWYWDITGTLVLSPADSVATGDTTVYASVTAGVCTSEIVPVYLVVLPSPQAIAGAIDLCGDANGETILNLTNYDTLVHGGSDTVLWYGNAGLTISVSNPLSFMTGDTTLYAVVSNGACSSPPAAVVITVSDGLSAIAQTLEFCVPQGDTLLIDLTQSNMDISGGVGTVQWFSDTLGTMAIPAPDAYPGTVAVTVYANITDGACVSGVVPVQLDILAIPVANPFTIKKCGDLNGEAVFNLAAIAGVVSGGSGMVSWFLDPSLTLALADASAFLSGDSVVYAQVVNGFCTSPGVAVNLEVVDSLTANSIAIYECVVDDVIAIIDLTLSDIDVSGGSGDVFWFTDPIGIDTIVDPGLFATIGDTIYAMVVADGCTSNVAQIIIIVENASVPVLSCDFTSIDSLAASWTGIADGFEVSYAINGQMIGGPLVTQQTNFGIGSLNQGDTLTLWVTAMYDSICAPQTNSITCITDVCPTQTLSLPGLASVYCRDEDYVLISAMPPGGQLSGTGISGDTLFLANVPGASTMVRYIWVDATSGCVYEIAVPVQISDPPGTPMINCTSSDINSIAFDWSGIASEFGYAYAINQDPLLGSFITTEAYLLVDNLNEGDEVTFYLWSIGQQPCGNSDTVLITCATKQCPPAIVSIVDPGIICSNEAVFALGVMINGLPGVPTVLWSGSGIVDPSGLFDPAVAQSGINRVMVDVEAGGCRYTAAIDITILEQPTADFELTGTPCIDSSLQIHFSGVAGALAQYDWDLNGGTIVAGSLPFDFEVQWPAPGDYMIELGINDNGCPSEIFTIPVQIGAPLDAPQIYCVEEDFYAIVIGWDPVPGATSYVVTSSAGVGVQTGNTYRITHLPDNTMVDISVTAMGPSACGPVTATVECMTMDYIPPVTYIPNIFSPNHDGFNDVFYIQSNEQITTIESLRIYDRWGAVIFEDLNFLTNDTHHGWDGTYGGKELDPGVFVYTIVARTATGQPLVLYGDVTLIR